MSQRSNKQVEVTPDQSNDSSNVDHRAQEILGHLSQPSLTEDFTDKVIDQLRSRNTHVRTSHLEHPQSISLSNVLIILLIMLIFGLISLSTHHYLEQARLQPIDSLSSSPPSSGGNSTPLE